MIGEQILESLAINEPLLWLTLTIGVYMAGDFLYKKCRLFPLCHPVTVSIVLIGGGLVVFDIDYQRYFDGSAMLHFLLGPATVALAFPIYKKRHIIFAYASSIFLTIVAGSLFAIAVTYGMTVLFALEQDMVLTLLPRSVTTPIAISLLELVGGFPLLAASLSIITGIIGASFAPFVLRVLGIKSMPALGFSMGLGSHGIGTARALSLHETAGAFAAIAMGLNGIVTAFLLPAFLYVLGITEGIP